MITYPLVLLTIIVLILLRALRNRKIKAGSVEIGADTDKIDDEQATEENPDDILDDPRIFLLYEMIHHHLRKINDLMSPSAILSAQMIAASNEINIYTTAALSQLATRDDFDDISRDVELFRFRLIDFVVLIYRENHLCEMDEGQFLSHLRIRSQTATNMSIIHMMRSGAVHPFLEIKNTNDIMTVVVQILITGRDIAFERNRQAAEAEAEHDRKIKAILRGDYKAILQKVC